jgi:hypothetical protein
MTPKFDSIMDDFYSILISFPKHAFLKVKTLMYLFIILIKRASPVLLHSNYSTTSLECASELLNNRGVTAFLADILHILTAPWLSPKARMLQGSPFHSYRIGEKLAQLIEEA